MIFVSASGNRTIFVDPPVRGAILLLYASFPRLHLMLAYQTRSLKVFLSMMGIRPYHSPIFANLIMPYDWMLVFWGFHPIVNIVISWSSGIPSNIPMPKYGLLSDMKYMLFSEVQNVNS